MVGGKKGVWGGGGGKVGKKRKKGGGGSKNPLRPARMCSQLPRSVI